MYGKGVVTVLPEETKTKFGYDVESLHPGSHFRVVCKCTRCQQVIMRDFRHLFKKHACPVYVNKNGVDMKWCNRCEQFMPLDVFYNNAARYDGKAPCCKSCYRFLKNTVKHQHNKKLQLHTLDGWMESFFKNKRSKAKKYGMAFELDVDFLRELWNKQDGKCFYTLLSMEFGKNTLKSASLERLDSSVGYIKSNVVWASKAINFMKNKASQEEFANFLYETGLYFKKPVLSFECKAMHPNAKLPTRGRPTDACFDIYACEDVILQANSVTDVRTGIRISPPIGYYLTIEGRSSLFKYGIEPLCGVIDATYTGETVVTLNNTSKLAYAVKSGDRVAQIAIHKTFHIEFMEVEEFSLPQRLRGESGFGSSGK